MRRPLLLICPTKERISQFKRMVESFKSTKHYQWTWLYAIIDKNDKMFDEYMSYFSEEKGDIDYYINENQTVTQAINHIFRSQIPLFSYYGITNDDFIFRTSSWDLKLIDHKGIAYPNDLCARETMPTHAIVYWGICETLGWLQLPGLTSMYGDFVWKYIGHRLNRLYYHKDVIIEHMHFMNRKAEKDPIYERTNSLDVYKKDYMTAKEYIIGKINDDIKKLNEALND
jgi:hypothetical protein